MISFLDHLYRKTRSQKHKHVRVLMNEEDATIITWILAMQKCGLLHQLKLKVVELTQSRPTPFWNGVLKNNRWY
jgi:succinate dehydrogenase flavin-adding protein (antitoxin of CptAB toxin-antitoxin module)